MGSELYAEEQSEGYWRDLVRFTKHMSLARTMRTLTIMGRSEKEEKIDLAKLLYPPMQALDIHYLDVDIAHAGMDQRKIHMLVRDSFPKMGWKVPVAIHHKLLPGLQEPNHEEKSGQVTATCQKCGLPRGPKDIGPCPKCGHKGRDIVAVVGKMSKSDPDSSILIHNSDNEIQSKIKKAWCEEGNIDSNPLLEISKQILFHELNEMKVERPQKFGGNTEYSEYSQLESDFATKKLHPSDLKQTVANHLIKVIGPIREKLLLSDDLLETIKNSS